MGLPRARRPDPDRRIGAQLYNASCRHAAENAPDADAVAELREIANGRADLLGIEAGIALGSIGTCVDPVGAQRRMELLIAAGADLALIPTVAAEAASRLRMDVPPTRGRNRRR